jgi:flagellar hook-length control protein FliK
MISNQATSSANMTGNIFQIFNLPKAGNSSYLFSDIIKVIGGDSETDSANGLLSLLPADSGKTLIDSNKLINLLNTNINSAGDLSEDTGEALTGKYYITENDLAEFINKLGLEETASIAKQSSEIAIEVTPDFLNKLSALINSNKPAVDKNIFATIAPEEEEITTKINSDGEEAEEAEGTGKIQVIFKKVTEENDVIAAPQPIIFNTEQNYALSGGKIAPEEDLLLDGKTKNIVLDGSKFDFFTNTAGGQEASVAETAEVKPVPVETIGVKTAPVETAGSDTAKQTLNLTGGEVNTFQAAFNAEIDAAAETKIPISNALFVSEETDVSTPVIKVPVDTKIKIMSIPSVETEVSKQNTAKKETAMPVESEPANLQIEDTSEAYVFTEVKTNYSKNELVYNVKPEVKSTIPANESKTIVVEDEAGGLNTETSDTAAENSKIEINNNFKAEITTGTPEKNNIKQVKAAASVVAKITSNTASDKAVNVKTADAKLQETENQILTSGTPVENDKQEATNTPELNVKSNTYIRQVKTNTFSKQVIVDTEAVNENSETKHTQNSSASEDIIEQEPESTFRFSSSFSNELFGKQNNSINQVKNKNVTSSDNSKLYEVILEKTRPENNAYAEKILPQDFDTSDYETLSSGIFNGKMAESIKEYKNPEKYEADEKNSLNVNKEVKESNSAEEQAANTGNSNSSNSNSSNSEANHKQSFKSGNEEILFADQLQSKSAQVNQAAETKPVKNYTPLFKEVNAANLIDEVKNLCFKGEKTNITLKLTPEHLGNVKLSIDIKDSVMNTSIEVENESVRQVVQNNMDNLRQSLQQNGILLNSFSVSLSNQHEQKSSGKSGSKKGKQEDDIEIKISADEKTVRTKKMGYNTYEYLA